MGLSSADLVLEGDPNNSHVHPGDQYLEKPRMTASTSFAYLSGQ